MLAIGSRCSWATSRCRRRSAEAFTAVAEVVAAMLMLIETERGRGQREAFWSLRSLLPLRCTARVSLQLCLDKEQCRATGF